MMWEKLAQQSQSQYGTSVTSLELVVALGAPRSFFCSFVGRQGSTSPIWKTVSYNNSSNLDSSYSLYTREITHHLFHFISHSMPIKPFCNHPPCLCSAKVPRSSILACSSVLVTTFTLWFFLSTLISPLSAINIAALFLTALFGMQSNYSQTIVKYSCILMRCVY